MHGMARPSPSWEAGEGMGPGGRSCESVASYSSGDAIVTINN